MMKAAMSVLPSIPAVSVIAPIPTFLECQLKAQESLLETFVVFECKTGKGDSDPTDAQYDHHFEAELDLIDSLGEFRGISCHPVYGLGYPYQVIGERCPDGPYGIKLIAGKEEVLVHFLLHVYAELYDTKRDSSAGVVSANGIRFLRYRDRCSVLIEYGIGDIPALLEVVEHAKHCIGHSDFHRDHIVLEQVQP